MSLDELNIDYETFSETDLPKVGSDVYSRDPSTEVLMAAYSLNGSKEEQWIPAEGQPMPKYLAEAIVDPEVRKWAWNAPFEMNITENSLGIPVDVSQWRCTMAFAQLCSYPGSLEKAGPAVGLPLDKLKNDAGKKLIRKFSMLKKSRRKATMGQMVRTYWFDDLDDWENYLEYNRDDVVAEKTILKALKPYAPPAHEWELWELDQLINRKGIPINLDMVHNAVRLYDESYAIGFREMQELTRLSNPMSTQQLLPWLQANGYPFDDLKKGHVKQARSYFDQKPDHWDEMKHLEYQFNEELEKVLDLRLELSRSSITKFHALQRATDPIGNGQFGLLRYTLQFAGAQRTARWAGRIFQPQNIPKPEKKFEKEIEVHAANIATLDRESIELIYPNTFDVLASTIRPAAQAPDGQMFLDADLNAIENRVLGWLARCRKILRVFELGRDPYVDFATYLFHRPYDELFAEYKAGNSAKRTIAKPGVLGCGYMLGPGATYEDKDTGEIEATGLLGYAWGMGVRHFTLEDSKLSVDTFRREFKEVKDYWYSIERAMMRCIPHWHPAGLRPDQLRPQGAVSAHPPALWALSPLQAPQDREEARPVGRHEGYDHLHGVERPEAMGPPTDPSGQDHGERGPSHQPRSTGPRHDAGPQAAQHGHPASRP
ncbi:DNA polymerase I [Synechococcus virus S-ESS1]|uniref:DNA polymerase I n=1 Tax=Synechococcus virus S-ESS1 TaxID=1964565 RepID=A0A1V0DX18_9CAUD|nr:DNA polymerase I [Synechococcus virus S-ESS1]ARB05699.1 DNA polymerase I [Synechococcus virus S-ESS1]